MSSNVYESAPRHYMTFDADSNPFKFNGVDNRGGIDYFNADTQFLEHCAPRSIFSTSAQKYTDGQAGCEEITQAHTDIVSLFLYIYAECFRRIFIPRQRGRPKQNNKKPDGNDDETAAAVDGDEQQQLDEQSDGMILKRYFDNRIENRQPNALFATMEKCNHYKSNHMSCMKLRIAINTKDRSIDNTKPQELDFGSIVFSLLTRNETREAGPRNKRNVTEHAYEKITFERYFKLVGMYTGVDIPASVRCKENVMLPGSPVHPKSVFDLYHSHRIARTARAHNMFWDMNQYVNDHGIHNYPDPACVYLLDNDVMKSANFFGYLWPHVAKPTEDDAQRKLFVRQFVNDVDVDVDDECDEDDRQRMERDVGRLYDQYCRCKVSDSNAMDLAGLKRRQTVRMRNAFTIAAGDFDKLRTLRAKVQMDGLEEFQQLFHRDGDVPDSIKAIADWIDKHLVKYYHFCLPFKKQSRNLSRFADVLASLSAQLESVFGVATLQEDIICGVMKAFHVYSNKMFHAHTLFFGPPKIGKTFAFQVLQMLLIPKTWQEYASMTPKSNTAPGKKYNHLIEFLEEAPPSMLDIGNPGTGTGANKKQSSDVAAAMKLKLTRSKITHKLLMMDPVTAKRTTMDLEIEYNTVMFFASNDHASDVSLPMLSRFHYKTFQQAKERDDHGGVMTKMQVNADPKFNRVKQSLIYRMQRNQALVAIVYYMIEGGILAPIDLTVAYIVFYEVMKLAREKGLSGTDDVRNFERLCFVAEVLVILEAIDTVFDSELSPFIIRDDDGKPTKEYKTFEWRDMLIIEPYLKASVETCTIALGLLHDQFENEVTKNVVKTLIRTFYKGPIENEAKNTLPYPTLEAERKKHQANFLRNDPKYHDGQGLASWNIEYDEKLKANKEYEASFDSLYYSTEFPIKHTETIQDKNRPTTFMRHDNNNNKQLSTEELITKLAESLGPKMSPRPERRDLLHALHMLNTLPVKNSSGVTSGGDFALQFQEGRMYFARSLVSGFEHDSLKTIVKEVLDRVTLNKRQYIYGETYDKRPYIWDTIVVDPDKNDHTPLQVVDPNYFDDAVQSFTLAAVTSMDDGLLAAEVYEREPTLFDIFSNQPTLTIDESLDKYVSVKRLDALKLIGKDLEGKPSVLPSEYRRQIFMLMSKRQVDALKNYPQCFPLTLAQQQEDHKRKRIEEHSSARMKTAKISELRGYDIGDDVDESVCEIHESVAKELDDMNIEELERAEGDLFARLQIDLRDHPGDDDDDDDYDIPERDEGEQQHDDDDEDTLINSAVFHGLRVSKNDTVSRAMISYDPVTSADAIENESD